MKYKASDILIEKLKEFEGCRLTAYRCPAGVPTIGYGHTKGVKMGMKITQAQADALLKSDLKPFENYVNKLLVCTSQGQFDALVDFSFNLGTVSLERSTLLKLIRQHASTDSIQKQFMKWVYAGGKKLAGLEKRRAWEALRYAQ